MVELMLPYISLSVYSVIFIAVLLSVIRNGLNIVNRITDWYYNKKYHHLVLTRSSSLVPFIAMCEVLSNNRKQIKCSHWQMLSISDTQGKSNNFYIPSAGNYIDYTFEPDSKVIIQIAGADITGNIQDIIGFKIFFSKKSSIGKFIEATFREYLSSTDLTNLMGYCEVSQIINPGLDLAGVKQEDQEEVTDDVTVSDNGIIDD